MKVALFNDTFAPQGGTERHLVDAASVLEPAGIETLFVSTSQDDSPVVAHPFPELFVAKPFQQLTLHQPLQTLEHFLRAQQVDVVHLVHMHNPVVSRFLAERWPTVRTFHTPYLFCIAGTRYLPGSKQVCTRTCGPHCLAVHLTEGCIRYHRQRPFPLRHQIKKFWEIQSNLLANLTLHRYGVASQYMKDLLCQHGYTESLIDIIPPPLTPILEAIAPTEIPVYTPPTIVFVGRLIPEKGVADVLSAMLLMKTQARLIIVGDGPERPLLEEDARTLGLSDRVEFRGTLLPEESRLVYQEGWLTVVPSHWPEPFGFTGIESFLNHRPVVAYNVGGIREWLIPEQNGILVQPYNIPGLAQAMDDLLQNPAKGVALAVEGNRMAREKFSADAHVALKRRFYEAAVQAFGKEPRIQVPERVR